MRTDQHPVALVATSGHVRRFSDEQKVLADAGGRPVIRRGAAACGKAVGPRRQRTRGLAPVVRGVFRVTESDYAWGRRPARVRWLYSALRPIRRVEVLLLGVGGAGEAPPTPRSFAHCRRTGRGTRVMS